VTECVRRPKTYADRMWLEGWREEVDALTGPVHLSRGAAQFLIRAYRTRLTCPWYAQPTARETGRMDALLDAWGC
jgi:hypothetical protein